MCMHSIHLAQSLLEAAVAGKHEPEVRSFSTPKSFPQPVLPRTRYLFTLASTHCSLRIPRIFPSPLYLDHISALDLFLFLKWKSYELSRVNSNHISRFSWLTNHWLIQRQCDLCVWSHFLYSLKKCYPWPSWNILVHFSAHFAYHLKIVKVNF